MDFLSEAFKSLRMLNEETFDLSVNGEQTDLKDFLDNDEEIDTVTIIDDEAETEEELKDSYIGKVVLDCNVCHSLIYKDPKDVTIEDEEANINEECPYCFSTGDGFKIVGQIKPFTREEQIEDEKEEEDSEEDIDEVEEKEEIELDESVCNARKRRNKALQELFDLDVDASGQTIGLGFGGGTGISQGGGAMPGLPGLGEDIDEDEESLEESFYHVFKGDKDKDKWTLINTLESPSACRKYIAKVSNDSRPLYVYKGDRRTPVEVVGDDFMYVKDGSDSPVFINKFGEIIDEDICPECGKNPCECECDEQNEALGVGAGLALGGAAIGAGILGSKLVDSLDEENPDEEIRDEADEIEDREDDDAKEINESIENLSLDTEDTHMEMTSDEGGKVTITTEPKQCEECEEVAEEEEVEADDHISDEETIGEVDLDTELEIEKNGEEDTEAEVTEDETVEEEPTEDEEVEVDEFDEDSFDELGESYLKKVYENVDSFKCINISDNENKLFIEGLITFNSGNQKKTKFVFENQGVSADGKTIFEGFNKEIARGNKSFTLNGVVSGNKIVCESLQYRYNQDKNKVSGTVRRK